MKFHRAYKTDRNPTFGVQGLHKNCWVELIDSCVTQSSDLSWLLVDLSSCPRCGGGRRHVGWMIDQIGWGEGETWGSEDVGELDIDWKWSNFFGVWWNCRFQFTKIYTWRTVACEFDGKLSLVHLEFLILQIQTFAAVPKKPLCICAMMLQPLPSISLGPIISPNICLL